MTLSSGLSHFRHRKHHTIPVQSTLTKAHTESVFTENNSKFPKRQLNHTINDQKEEVVQTEQHVISALSCLEAALKTSDWWRSQTG